MEKIQQWYKHQQLMANQNQKDFISTLSLVFNAAPYTSAFNEDNVVWGFRWEHQEFIVYYSSAGIMIQAQKKFRKDKIDEFLSLLVDVLTK